MEPYDDGSVVDDEGPIIQEIPDALMVGDYIEIHGTCRGPEIIVQLLSRNDPNVLPLHVGMGAGGPVVVKSQSREKVDRQEHNVRMGIQPNMDFELCIYATQEGYEIKLNKKSVCIQKHLVKLEDVSAISMDGDADFTSVEFKDIYGDEDEDVPSPSAAPEPGFMRVQEMRESFSRQKGSPMIVRSSIRRSQRSEREINVGRQTWATSEDLSRPSYDVDHMRYSAQRVSSIAPIPVEMRSSVDTHLPKTKSSYTLKPGSRKSYTLDDDKKQYSPYSGSGSNVLAGNVHPGTFRQVDEGYAGTGSLATLNESSGSLADSKKKKRGSIFGRFRKSKGSQPDVSIGDSDRKKKRESRNPFKKRKSLTSTPISGSGQFNSMPDVSSRDDLVYSRPSTDSLHTRSHYFGAAADRAPVRGPVPKSVCKEPAPEIAAYISAQKAVPEFEDFMLVDRAHREDTSAYLMSAQSTARAPSQVDVTADRKLKGTAPELADILLDTRRAGYDQTTTLTSGELTMPARGTEYREFTPPRDTKTLKGPAPAIAASLDDGHYPSDTLYVSDLSTVGHTTLYDRPQTVVVAPSSREPVGKLKGPAPELADVLYDRHRSTLYLTPETTITGGHVQQRQSYADVERPKIDRDPRPSQPMIVRPEYETRPVYATRPVSTDRHPPARTGSDTSSIHSDGEYYLDVGKSNYYFERLRSLKNYRSYRARRVSRSESGGSSARSSVSSLKPDDRVIYARKGRSGYDDRQHTWVNGYGRDGDMYSSTPARPKVYAAPPVNVLDSDPIDLILEKEQLKQSNNCARIPVALTTGRSAVLEGHFYDQFCNIHVKPGGNPETEELVFKIEECGRFSFNVVKNGHQCPIATYELLNNNGTQEKNGQFSLRLHARGSYLGVTVNGYYSVIIRENLDPSCFEQIHIPQSLNAELDYFSVDSHLTIPLTLQYPETLLNSGMQILELKLRADADSEKVLLEFDTEKGIKFTLVLNMLAGHIFLRSHLEETERQIIPFVPEQLRRLVVFKKIPENVLTVLANQQEILQQPIPTTEPVIQLKSVRLSGDMLLLGIRFE